MGLSELEESSLQLDEKLVRFMDQLELLEEKRATLNSLIEQGWFSVFNSRYSMGNKQVSALQYASEMEPTVCVHARTLDNGEVKFCTDNITPKCDESETNMSPVENIGPQEAGVRRRNKPKKDDTEKEESEKPPEGLRQRKGDQNPQRDPLKWFGILVPQSLKQAQSSFKQVIELSAEIATLQTAVLNARQELTCGMKEKHLLHEAASAARPDGAAD